MNVKRLALVKALALVLAAGSAWADITIGVSVSATGPAASLGIPEKQTFALLPQTVGGEKVRYIVLDDATDPSTAVCRAWAQTSSKSCSCEERSCGCGAMQESMLSRGRPGNQRSPMNAPREGPAHARRARNRTAPG